jgi:hypothetical protein
MVLRTAVNDQYLGIRVMCVDLGEHGGQPAFEMFTAV